MNAGAAPASAYRRRLIEWLERLRLISIVNRIRGLGTLVTPHVAAGNVRWRLAGAPDKLPLPPTRLVYLVSNRYDLDWFLESGREGFACIVDVLRKNDIDLNALGSVLDFGCGCGRVTRHFNTASDVSVHGTDYNRLGVEWAATNLPFAHFSTNRLEPPLDFPDQEFGFVWAFSVFTHLSEDLHRRWFDELCRIVKPGGYLLISTHGEHYCSQLTAEEQVRFHQGQLVVRMSDRSGANLCNAFCSEQFVTERLVQGAEVVDFIPQGARGNPEQDLYLIQVH